MEEADGDCGEGRRRRKGVVSIERDEDGTSITYRNSN